MPRPGSEGRRSWLIPVAVAALAPKCLLCTAAYAGLAVSLGPEVCGASPTAPGWLSWLAAAGAAVLLVRFTMHRSRRS